MIRREREVCIWYLLVVECSFVFSECRRVVRCGTEKIRGGRGSGAKTTTELEREGVKEEGSRDDTHG